MSEQSETDKSPQPNDDQSPEAINIILPQSSFIKSPEPLASLGIKRRLLLLTHSR